jgi:hypothetical protein
MPNVATRVFKSFTDRWLLAEDLAEYTQLAKCVEALSRGFIV